MSQSTSNSSAASSECSDILLISPGVLTCGISKMRQFGGYKKEPTCKVKFFFNEIKFTKRGFFNICKQLGEFYIQLKYFIGDKYEGVYTTPNVLISPRFTLNHQDTFEMPLNASFLDLLAEKSLVIELSAVQDNESLFIGGCHLLVNIGPEVNRTKQEARARFENDSISEEGSVAYLKLTYRFDFDQSSFNAVYINSMVGDKQGNELIKTEAVDELNRMDATKAEIEMLYESILMVMNKNRTLRTEQSEITNELRRKVLQMHLDANWKKTLQENAILSGGDPAAVVWRQWRTEATKDITVRSYYEEIPSYRTEFSITLSKLSFPKDGVVLNDPKIEQIFLEYSFMNYEGAELETPSSYAKPKRDTTDIEVEFTKVFKIGRRHVQARQWIAAAIENDERVRILVVNEPYERVEEMIQTCKAFGFAMLSLNRTVNLHKENLVAMELPIYSVSNVSEEIGTLHVELGGVQAVRQMALNVLKPSTYNLIF